MSTLSGERIAVIGGGSTGASTAYHLAKMGRKVVLIDRDQIASGMTSRSTALVRTHYSNEIVARMALYSLRTFEHFSIGSCGFVRNGMLILASKSDRDALDSNLSMLNGIGVRNEIYSREDAKRRFPELDFGDTDYILFEPESGYADPVGTANAYAERAREMGAEFLLGQEVARLKKNGDRLASLELADGRSLECKKAILCTNVWTNKLLSRSGMIDELPIWSVAHPVIIFKRPATYQGIRASIVDFAEKTYYKPEGNSLFFAGSLDPSLDRERMDPDQCPSEVPFEFMNSFSEAITRRIPVMREGALHSSYIGMYDMTPDQHPIIDSLSSLGFEGLFCCVGLSGHGFKLAPALGQMNAEMLTESVDVTFDRKPFALERFRTGKLLRSKYSGVGTVA